MRNMRVQYAALVLSSLATLAGFVKAETPTGLVLWNRLESSASVCASEIGPNGTFKGGSFTAGVFGQAFVATAAERRCITFPCYPVINATAGTIEFWAKLIGYPTNISGGPIFIASGSPSWLRVELNNNDGLGHGGVVGVWRHQRAYTGNFGIWTYDSVLGAGQRANWHHYALVWASGGIPGLSGRKLAVYIDGVLKTPYEQADPYGWYSPVSPTAMLDLLEGAGVANTSVAFDNLKIWSITKTDFSDRLVEDAGASPCVWTVSGSPAAYGAPVPDGYGIRTNYTGRILTNQVEEVVSTAAGTRQVCMGWTGTGSVPAVGATTSVTFTITNDSTVVWQWRAEHRLEVTAGTGGTVGGGGWYAEGTDVTISASAATGFRFLCWNDGVNVASRQVVVPSGGASYTASFEPLPPGTVRFQQSACKVREDAGSVQLAVERVGGSYGAAGVTCATSGITASAGTDFASASSTLSWADGEAGMKRVSIAIVRDRLREKDETFSVLLTKPSGVAAGSPAQATVTIVNWPPRLLPGGVGGVSLSAPDSGSR